MRTSRCRDCNQPIRWAETERGKRVALNPWPDRDGMWAIRSGIALVLPWGAFEPGEKGFTRHFDTCTAKQKAVA